MENSLLSVVLIAKRNTTLSILKALNSIFNQIYSPIRVLVADANEPNSIYSLSLQEDLAAYPNVDYLKMDQLLSIAEIRNYILDYVEGEYIAFLNSDDSWDAAKALLQLEQLKSNAEAAASSSNGMLLDKRKAHIAAEPLIDHLTFDASRWILDNPAKMSAQVIYHTKSVKEAGGFDGRFTDFMDGDMLIRLSKRKKVLIIPVNLCECSITPDNKEYEFNELRDCQNILDKYMDILLVNKKMSQIFYIRMIQLARANYLWLNYFGYILIYFMKAPFRSVLLLFRTLGKFLKYLLKWLLRCISQVNENIRLRKDIRLFQKGKFEKVKALKPVIPRTVTKEKNILFSSARQYNEENSLDFLFNHRVKHIVIPEYVTVIKKSMFYGCDQLVSVEIPNTVQEIQARAFQNCKSLKNILLKEGSRLGKIGAYAFAGCSALENISLPSGIVEIGKGAFAECCALRKLNFTYMRQGEEKEGSIFPTALVKIPRYTFAGCTNLSSVEFGQGSMLEFVGRGAFMGCGSLKKIFLTGKVKVLGSYAFAYCKQLETAILPQIDTLEYMGEGAFMYCEALTYFQLPTQIGRIYERTFYGCSGLKQIKIPKKVLSINHQAFAKCTSLVKAIILSGDIAISPTAFEKRVEFQRQENFEEEKASK